MTKSQSLPQSSTAGRAVSGVTWRQRNRPNLPELMVLLRQRRYKITRQRAAVLEALVRLKHASAETLHREARRLHRKVSLATVYNCLELLRRSGCLQEFVLPGGSAVFEVASAPHPHRICYHCGHLEDVEAELLEDWSRQLSGSSGFELKDLSLQLYGSCARCQPKPDDEAGSLERRRFPRTEASAQAQILPIKLGRLRLPLRGQVRSIGEGGLMLELEDKPELLELLPEGSGRLKVRFQLPRGEGSVRSEGEVVRLSSRDGRIGVGLRFLRLDPAQRQRIAAYLRDQSNAVSINLPDQSGTRS
ncbi:MAG TPA: transcriptional repressor [Acidobacteriota bacterium]